MIDLAGQVFRAKAVDRLSSPEQINDYLRVTKPSVWIALIVVVVLLVGALLWSSMVSINSYAQGTATVEDGTMAITFENPEHAKNVEVGMSVDVGASRDMILSVGVLPDGAPVAHAQTSLADGTYPARVSYRQTQVLKLLFN